MVRIAVKGARTVNNVTTGWQQWQQPWLWIRKEAKNNNEYSNMHQHHVRMENSNLDKYTSIRLQLALHSWATWWWRLIKITCTYTYKASDNLFAGGLSESTAAATTYYRNIWSWGSGLVCTTELAKVFESPKKTGRGSNICRSSLANLRAMNPIAKIAGSNEARIRRQNEHWSIHDSIFGAPSS